MHLADGTLSAGIWLPMWILAGALIIYSIYKLKGQKTPIPLVGAVGAIIFAMQALNYPVSANVSAHFLGGTFAGIMLGAFVGAGPWMAMLVVSVVIAAQALLFGDGGVLVMGANIFNMGMVGVLIGWYLYKMKENHAMIFIASFVSILAGSLLCALQLAFSGTMTFGYAMGTFYAHLPMALGEGLITVGLVYLLYRVYAAFKAKMDRTVMAGAVFGFLAFMVIAMQFASGAADTLETYLGALPDVPEVVVYTANPLSEYTTFSTILGTIVVFGLCFGLNYLLLPEKAKK